MSGDGRTIPARAGKGKSRAGLVALKLALLGVVLYYVGKALYADFRELWASGVEINVNYLYLLLAVAALLLARLMNGINCATLISALGHTIPARKVVPVIWLASLGRYIPGKMAVVAGATVMFARQGVRIPVALTAMFVGTAMVILVGLVACIPLLFTPAMVELFPQGRLVSVVMLAAGVVCLAPPVFLRLCNRALRFVKREPMPDRIRFALFLRAIAQTVLRVLFQGLGVYLAALSLQSLAPAAALTAVASASLASVAGFIAVFTPAGLGVHEAVYLVTMKPLLGAKVALLVVLVRACHVAADAVAGAIAAIVLRTGGSAFPGAAVMGPHPGTST